ncbi:MAG TPA: carboxypeptidase [Xanthobacteraceae bacterium]|nr:carboxypeptidase [Xanthobacteraceae bacterium]
MKTLTPKAVFLEAIMIKLCRAVIVLSLAVLAGTVFAQERPDRAVGEHPGRGEQIRPNSPGHEPPGGPGVLSLLPGDAVTQHSITLSGGGKLDYTATAGTFSLFDQSGERSAAVFYTAFVAKGADPARRPVTFVFNGGPGAASAFLNLGLVGPRLAEFGSNGRDGAHVRMIDNPDTWLAFTDLVLIDPIGTGWSRAAKPDGDEPFWGVRADAGSMAKVIALYVAKNGRVSSPKFILGESYGGFRAAKVARALQSEQGMSVSGILMLSPMLEGAFQFGGDRFALGAALQLPSLAAAEMERKGTFSEQAQAQAEHFALNDYLTTLAGPPLQGDAAKTFYARVAAMTGLPQDVVARQRGFIGDAYVKELHAGEHKIVSYYDATFAVDDPNPESSVSHAPDPILDGLIRSYGSAFVSYARDELGFKTDMTYNLLNSETAGRWKWGDDRSRTSVAEDLRVLFELTPSFRLMIAHGYSDMVTPYAMSRYVLDHLPAAETEERAQLKLYRGGHMFYLDPDSRKAFTADARTMYPPS